VGGVIAAAAIACGDETGPSGPPAALVKIAGDSQSSVVGSALPGPLSVRVTDAKGRSVSGVTVTFAVTSGRGTFDHPSAATGGDGVASAHWVIGDTAGTNQASVSASSLSPVTFTATGLLGAAAQIVTVSGDSQVAMTGAALDSEIVVRVTDAHGNPISGRTVTFAVSAGGLTSVGTMSTDISGSAKTFWTLGGTEGTQSLQVTSPSLPTLQVAATAFPALPLQRLSMGNAHGCWLTLAGAAYCWGFNLDNELGDGTHTTRYQPVPVAGGRSYLAISASADPNAGQTCGIASDSLPYCWGTIFVSRPVPTPVAGAPKLASVTTGADYACGLTAGGTAFCWGSNGAGQLGDGSQVPHDVPAPVTGAIRFRQISAGLRHVCGVSRTGQLYCWGYDLVFLPNNPPVSVPTLIPTTARFTSVAVDAAHQCAVALGGDLYCWGDNFLDAVTADNGGGRTITVPTRVMTSHHFVRTGLGSSTTCGLEADGSAFCWGSNLYYTIGDTVAIGVSTPRPVAGGLHFLQVDGGSYATCGITVSETAFCWGSNVLGTLGIQDSTQRLTPVAVTGGLSFSSISTGTWHSCGLTTQGFAYCWGENREQPTVGDGTQVQRSIPTAVAGGHQFASLSASGLNACGIDLQGAAWCWGKGSYGVLGNGALVDRPIPTPVGGGLVFSSISVGLVHACALTVAGDAWCWGADLVPGPVIYGLPVKVTSPEPLTEVSVNDGSPCGLGASGAAYCWTPRGDSIGEVAALVPGGLHFTHIATDFYGFCGLVGPGDAYCWAPAPAGTGLPTLVPGGITFTQLARGSGGTICGVAAGGAAYCWGANDFGQMGNGSLTTATNPTPVAGGLGFTSVKPAIFHTCGVTTSGAGYCWGNGSRGMLGTGATIFHPIPVQIQ
jgi:alpha-tubulin suppressor-like RCC1 family protein